MNVSTLWRAAVLAAVLLAFQTTTSQAQLSLTLPVINNAVPGVFITVPVTVQGFDSIVSAQFAIEWDENVIAFEEISALGNLPDLDVMDNFGLGGVDTGIVRFAWWFSGSMGQGASLPDGAMIFTMKFKVIGPLNSGTPLVFTQTPPNLFFELVNSSGKIFDLTNTELNNGFVAVGYVVSAGAPAGISGLAATVSPNPCGPEATLWLEAESSMALEVLFCDSAGRVLATQEKYLNQGKYGMEIATMVKDYKGVGTFIVRTSAGMVTIPVFVL